MAGTRRPPSRPDTPAQARWKLIRDVFLTVLGSFMLIWQTVVVSSPQPLILGAALVLLGLPATLRLEDVFRR